MGLKGDKEQREERGEQGVCLPSGSGLKQSIPSRAFKLEVMGLSLSVMDEVLRYELFIGEEALRR